MAQKPTRGKPPSLPPMTPCPVSRAVVSNMYWVPVDEVNAHRVRKYFTVHKTSLDHFTKRFQYISIPIYKEDPENYPGMIGVPIADGERFFPADDLVEDFCDPGTFDVWTRLPDPYHPQAAPGQDEFMQDALRVVQDNYTSLLKAETGTGKTVVFLWLAATLGVKTLIVVPTKVLMNQWIREIQEHLGVPRKHIGIVQGEKCQYGPEKQIVVGMQKSLAMRDYPPEFYRAFGLTGVDEVHNTGAELMSHVEGLFYSEYKTSLTATDKRRDGSDRVYHSYYGQPAFDRKMDGIPTRVQSFIYETDPIQGRTRMERVKALANDPERNEILARIAAHWYQNPANNVLLVSDLIDHCQYLARYVAAAGVPENDIGLFIAQSDDGDRRDAANPEYLQWCLETPRVLIATYGMFKEGTDRPNLNRGLDCTPRGEMEQLLGRIRRRMPGKEDALWVTPRDRRTPALDGLFYQRIRSIKGVSNVQIEKTTLDAILRS